MAEREEGPRSFARFIEQLGDGDVHQELSDELYDLGRQLLSQARARLQEVKGTLSLKLKFKADPKGVVDIDHVVEVKVPKPRRAAATMFLTKGGNLSPENPRQQMLPGIREVALPAETVREVDAPATGKEI